MTSLFVLDTPENRPVVEVAQRDQSVVVTRSDPTSSFPQPRRS